MRSGSCHQQKIMNEKTYYEILQDLSADCKKTELIITKGADAGSKALAADGRVAAWTGGAGARDFFLCLLREYKSDASAEVGGQSGPLDFRGTGEFAFEGRQVFYEQLEKKPRLVICGAGHVGIAICRVASITGLETIVIDDRPEFTAQAMEAGASLVICRPFEEALQEIHSDSRTCFILVTRGHAHGMECLRMILRKPHLYVGMMSSRTRAAAARETLLKEGLSSGEVRSVYMPIGLKIGAETPGEIAVSVMAQVISEIRMEGTGDGYPPEILDAITKGSSGVLVTIVHKSGEAPREPGTRMLVLADGSLRGSVGGGYAEAEITKAAKKMMGQADESSAFIRVEMPLVRSGSEEFGPLDAGEKDALVSDESMICGGKITVFLERIGF